MANWSKRRTTKAGNQGQRITRTTNSKGTSTYSFSKKVGNTRTTQSTSSKNGKIKVYTTESHPTLGTRRTVKTLNPTVKYKKPKKPRKTRAKKAKSIGTSSSRNKHYDWSTYVPSKPSPFWDWFWGVSFWWWSSAVLLLVTGAAWYIWLIYFSAFLKFNVDIFK